MVTAKALAELRAALRANLTEQQAALDAGDTDTYHALIAREARLRDRLRRWDAPQMGPKEDECQS